MLWRRFVREVIGGCGGGLCAAVAVHKRWRDAASVVSMTGVSEASTCPSQRPVVKQVPQTSYVQQIPHPDGSGSADVQVPETQTQMVPVTVNVSVPEQQVQEYDVPVTVMVPKQVTETVPVTTTVSVPEAKTETSPRRSIVKSPRTSPSNTR